MQLLLTNSRAAARAADEAPMTASDGAPADDAVHDVDAVAEKNVVVSSSTTARELLDPAAATRGDGDGASVFTSDQLDEYLAANDASQDAPSSTRDEAIGGVDSIDAAAGVKDPHGVDSNTLQDCGVSVSLRHHDEAGVQSVRSPADSPTTSTDDAELDIIDGFSFYSFSSPDALLQHVGSDGQSKSWRPDVPPPPPPVQVGRTKKFQYGIAGNLARYLARMKGWEQRTSTACDRRAEALDALLSDGMVRQLSDEATSGLILPTVAAAGDDLEDGVMWSAAAADAGRSCARFSRRSIGKMGDETRQPRRGRIYGFQIDGRFASKAKFKRHINQRPSAYGASTSADSEETAPLYLRRSGLDSARLLPNLQPRVDLTKAVFAARSSDNAGRPKAYTADKTVPVGSQRLHLIRLSEATARRAIVALQLAPSMTNSPVKCNKPSMYIQLVS